MRAPCCLLAALAWGTFGWAQASRPSEAPSYSAASIVNSASNLPGPLAPNTIATLYGGNLAYSTSAMSAGDIRGLALPVALAGVRVLVRNVPANIYYVSPGQVNFLVPSLLEAGPADVQLTRDGRAGPAVNIVLAGAAPALFLRDRATVIATRADGSLIGDDAPAHPGDDIVLYATGLGRTAPDAPYGLIPAQPAPLGDPAAFQVLVDGSPLEASRIAYAGLAPGFAGLYQINLKLPDWLGDDPRIQIRVGDQVSPPDPRLPARPE